jgi:hypothetical protein
MQAKAMHGRILLFAAAGGVGIGLVSGQVGCSSPSGANIELRKQLQDRDDQIATLQNEHQADLADLRASTRPTTTALPPDQIARLFTTHDISIGGMSGGSDLDMNKGADQGLKIYVVPTDDQGQKLKAAGSFTVDAFDLSLPDDNRIGHWVFDLDATRKSWFGEAFLYTYVLACPWQQRIPTHSSLTVRVTFHDELTGREFVQQKIVAVTPPPTSVPATAPNTAP